MTAAVVCLGAMAHCGIVRGDEAEKHAPPAAVAPPANTSGAGGAAGTTTPAVAERAAAPSAGTPALEIQVTLEDAVLMAFDRNPALAVERLKPPIQKTAEGQERAVFDPVLRGSYSQGWTFGKQDWDITSVLGPYNSRETLATAALDEYLPTGTKLTLEEDTAVEYAKVFYPTTSTAWYGSLRTSATVTQSLLRGFGLGPNLAKLREARLDTLGSEYEFRGTAESFVAQVEETYWNYAFSIQQVRIVEESLKLAELQLSDTREKVSVGKLPETEIAAARAEAALRFEETINAKSNSEKLRLRLLRLITPPQSDFWPARVALLNEPKPPEAPMEDVEEHVKVALQFRPELNQARLGVKRGDLEIVRTKNGLLPKLDAFINAGISGYGKTFYSAEDNYLRQYHQNNSYDVTAGANFEFPPLNRDASAQYRRAVLTRRQEEEAVDNLAELVQVDVRTAYVEATRTRELIGATAQTREFKVEALRAEREKFQVGKSTNFQLAQAERDALAAQIGEVEAVVNHLNALTELYRLDGSLLLRRHIEAPGAQPVDAT